MPPSKERASAGTGNFGGGTGDGIVSAFSRLRGYLLLRGLACCSDSLNTVSAVLFGTVESLIGLLQ